MDIYLIRHTKPDISKGICYGQSDIGLATNFNEESSLVVSKIPNPTACKVYTSPLKRCKQLALKINPIVIEDAKLMELNFGDWELQAWDDIPREDTMPWMTNFVNVATPHGESYIALYHRVWEYISYLTTLQTEQPIIVVTHAGPIRAILSKVLKINLKDSFNIPVNYGDIFQLKYTEDNLKLVSNLQL
jgi:alpha-ribazole phosphatase